MRHPAPARRSVSIALVLAAGLVLIAALFANWANRRVFSPQRWGQMSGQLLENPTVRSSTARYLVDEALDHSPAGGLIDGVLPAPVFAQIRATVVRGVDLALTEDPVRDLWADANRRADAAFISLADGTNADLREQGGALRLELGPVLDAISAGLQLPLGLRLHLGPQVAAVTVLRSRRLASALHVARTLHDLAPWLIALVLGLDVLAVLVAVARGRALALIGATAVLAGAAVVLLRVGLGPVLADRLAGSASARTIARTVWKLATVALDHDAVTVMIAGAVLALVSIAGSAVLRTGGPRRAT